MSIIANYHEGVGCSYHRVYLPAISLRDGGHSVSMWHESEIPPDRILRGTKIFWFNRVPTFPLDQLLEKRREFSFKIVVDVDDHWILYPHHEMAAAWARSKAHLEIQKAIMCADAVFVTNTRLKEAASELTNKEAFVVPNALPYSTKQFWKHRIASDKVRFMYAGGSSHLYDLKTISKTLNKLGRDSLFRDKGEIILAGYQHQYGQGKVDAVWTKMLNIVRASINYSAYPHRPIDSYMNCYHHADVALAPLEESKFNAHKSNLKILEAGCMNMPIIASKVEPYTLDDKCAGVILCSTTEEWYDAIRSMITHPAERMERGRILGEYVRERYSLGIVNRLRMMVFDKLLF